MRELDLPMTAISFFGPYQVIRGFDNNEFVNFITGGILCPFREVFC
jgi:hypothetical protein